MKVSIITATYNSENTIAGCIESIAMQTYDNIEHIVVDGNSKDNTLNTIKENTLPNQIIISEPDDGLYFALNKGIEKASGDIIGFLHADDLFANDTIIEQIVDCFQKSECNFLFGNLKYVDYSNTNKTIRYWQAGEFVKEKLKFGWMPPHPTVYIKNSLFGEIKHFDTSYSIAADYDLMLRALNRKNTQTFYLNDIIVKMRVGGKSNQSVKNIFTKSIEDLQIIRKNQIGGFFTLLMKNFRKLNQFFVKVKA